MKTNLILLFFAGTFLYAQEVNDLDIALEFFEPIKPTTMLGSEGTAFPSEDGGLFYSYAKKKGNENFNLLYYGESHKLADRVDCSIIDVYGQKFPLKGKWINPIEGIRHDYGQYGSILDVMASGTFYLFEHNNRKYAEWEDAQMGRNNGWYYEYFLFDITDRQQVTFLLFTKFAHDTKHSPEVGLYPKENGKLCTLITSWDDTGKAVYRTRLYSIEDGRLDEVLDKEGRNIELYYNWDKWEYDKIVIVEKNIPKNIRVEELTFRTVDYFVTAATDDELKIMFEEWEQNTVPATGRPDESEPEKPEIIEEDVIEVRETEAVAVAETVTPQEYVDKKYTLPILMGICLAITTVALLFIINKPKVIKTNNK